MGDVTVTRWRRYGKDRLYLKAADGTAAGWVDGQTGEEHFPPTLDPAPLRQAVVAFRHGPGVDQQRAGPPQQGELPRPQAPGTPVPPDIEAAPDVEASTMPAWGDLAAHVPGQLARERAEAEAAAAREHSRVGAFLARAFDAKTDERAWRVGAGGEETVGARLEKLERRGWHVLHSVPVGARESDIDHVLIGPGGVFTINTKTHPGGRVWVGRHAVRVNGHTQPYLRNSRHEAARASRLLSEACEMPVEVRPVLVFLTGTLLPNVTVKQQPEDVAVLDRMDIPGAFRRARRRLTDQQVEHIYDLARRSTTWKTGP